MRALALSLATEEGLNDRLSLEVVELAALLHDVGDWKYTGSETAGIEMARMFLEKNDYPQEKVRTHEHDTHTRTRMETVHIQCQPLLVLYTVLIPLTCLYWLPYLSFSLPSSRLRSPSSVT